MIERWQAGRIPGTAGRWSMAGLPVLVLLIALTVAPAGFAQTAVESVPGPAPDPTAGEAPATVLETAPEPEAGVGAPLYDVEVLIFSQRHADLDPEYWSDDRTLPVPERSAYLTQGQISDRLAFLELPPTRFRLAGAARRLEQAAGYQVLAHVAWRQPGLPGAESAGVAFPLGDRLSRSDTTGAATITGFPIPQGYVQVSLERFLHAAIRLRMSADPTHPAVIPEAGNQPVFSLDDTRRLRSGELHYIDHPALGVLIRVDAVR